jgi:hypothetical protein
MMAWDCRRAAAALWLRVEPMTALMPLNHMLKSGFFRSQGFRIGE